MSALFAKSAASGLAVCMALSFGAGANASEAPQPLVRVWITSKPLTTVEACIIKALDADQRTYSKLSPSIRHIAKIRIPNSIIEIRPVKDHAVADLGHYVRLENIANTITRVAFYSSDKSKQTMAKALAPCAPN